MIVTYRGPVFFAFVFACLLLLPAARSSNGNYKDVDDCDACQADVAELQKTWTNASTVAAILKELEDNCNATFGKRHPLKRQLCDDVAKIFVQIPPGLFDGLETLAWPIPLGVCATLGRCSTPCCAAGAPPEQVHLSLAGTDPTRMGVTWTTLEATGTGSFVEWSVDSEGSDEVQRSKDGFNETYPWGGWVGAIHRATMTGLQPGTTYRYRVGNGDNDDADGPSSSWSEYFSFTTLPSSEAFQENANLSVTLAVVADMGYGDKSNDTIDNLAALVATGRIHGVVHSGDVSYADGFMPHWDVFLNKIQAIAARVPYMTTPGNHELWYNFSAYKHRFLMPGMPPLQSGTPGISSSGDDGMYYTWSIPGLATFAALNSETPWDTARFGAQQLSWMDAELAGADEGRASEPWSLAHFHRPLYCSNNHQAQEFAHILRAEAEDIFVSRHVDLVINGHVHDYERTFPIKNGSATQFDYKSPSAPVYIIQGSSGNREGNSGFPEDEPAWAASHSSDIGFGLLTLSRSQAQWEFFNATSAGPVLLDSFVIEKSVGGR